MQLTDEHIKKIGEKGSVDEFRLLYESLFPSLILFTRRYVDNRESAADIVQEAMLICWNNRKRFSRVNEVKAFMYSTLRNMAHNYLRSQKVHDRFMKITNENMVFETEMDIAEEDLMEAIVFEEEVYSLLIGAMEGLTPREKEVMERCLAGEKNQEIANNLELSLNTVKTLKLRAYRHMRKKLKNKNTRAGRAAFSILICMM